MITIIGIDGAWKIVNAIADPRCSITINNDMGIICNFIFPIQIATKLFPKDLTTFKCLPIGFILKRHLKVVKSFGKSLVAICMGNMKLQMIPISLLMVMEHLGSAMALTIFQAPSIPMIVII